MVLVIAYLISDIVHLAMSAMNPACNTELREKLAAEIGAQVRIVQRIGGVWKTQAIFDSRP